MRTRLVLLVGLVAATAVVAGCLDEGSPEADSASAPGDVQDVDPDWALQALPADDDHDHTDPDQHRNRTTPNFEVVGYDPLITDYHGETSGDYLCGATDGNGDRRLSVVASWGSDVAFVLVDTTDPEDPKKVGEFVMQNTNVYDVDISPDLQHVVLGTAPYDAGPDDPGEGQASNPASSNLEALQEAEAEPRLTFRNACTGETQSLVGLPSQAGYTSGAVLVDIGDPSNPYVEDFQPLPYRGGHSVTVAETGNRTLAVTSTGGTPYALSYYSFFEIAEMPAGSHLQPLSRYQYDPAGHEPRGTDSQSQLAGYGAHDATIKEHPKTGETLAWLANGQRGLVILDIEDPANPELVGHWANWEALDGDQRIAARFAHGATPIDTTWDGRHYTFVGEECPTRPEDAPTCQVIALETTDPANPELVGHWTLPHEVPWDKQLRWSIHYLAVQDRTLFASTYHGGLWAIDVSSHEKIQEMPAVGVFLPTHESPKPVEEPHRSAGASYYVGSLALEGAPTVMDLDSNPDGTITVNDVTSGLYTVRFDESNPAPAKAGDLGVG